MLFDKNLVYSGGNLMKKALSYITVIFAAVISALSYTVFVLPNSFAPSGINGICVIIMELTGLNIGYLSLLLNIPLSILVYMKVNKAIAVRSVCYVIIFSVFLIVFQKLNSPVYHTENGTSTILGPLTSGVIMGCIYSVLIKVGAYTGGMDFVALLIQSKYPEKSVFSLNFVINVIIAVMSFIVFNFRIEPVLLSILYSFSSSTTADKSLRVNKSAMRFEIITDHCEEISREIITVLKHSATIVEAKGAYTDNKSNIIVCVINRSQIAVLYGILSKYPKTFAVIDPVSEVIGNFKHISRRGTPKTEVLDNGESDKQTEYSEELLKSK